MLAFHSFHVCVFSLKLMPHSVYVVGNVAETICYTVIVLICRFYYWRWSKWKMGIKNWLRPRWVNRRSAGSRRCSSFCRPVSTASALSLCSSVSTSLFIGLRTNGGFSAPTHLPGWWPTSQMGTYKHYDLWVSTWAWGEPSATPPPPLPQICKLLKNFAHFWPMLGKFRVIVHRNCNISTSFKWNSKNLVAGKILLSKFSERRTELSVSLLFQAGITWFQQESSPGSLAVDCRRRKQDRGDHGADHMSACWWSQQK